jgi:hypothetical protein
MFSATDSSSTPENVWYAMPRPYAWASPADAVSKRRPSMSISPASGARTPLAMPSSVDFPDPFSPTTAWISPLRHSMLTSSRACTAPKRLEIPFSERTTGETDPGSVDTC